MNATRPACLHGHGCTPTTPTELIYCLVHHSRVSAKQIAEHLGMRYGDLLDAANPDNDRRFYFERFLPLLQITQRWDAMETLAGFTGGIYFRLPPLTPTSVDLVEQTARVVREFADVLRVAADGTNGVTATEAQQIAKEGRDAIREVGRLVQLMELKAGVPVTTGRTLREVVNG